MFEKKSLKQFFEVSVISMYTSTYMYVAVAVYVMLMDKTLWW